MKTTNETKRNKWNKNDYLSLNWIGEKPDKRVLCRQTGTRDRCLESFLFFILPSSTFKRAPEKSKWVIVESTRSANAANDGDDNRKLLFYCCYYWQSRNMSIRIETPYQLRPFDSHSDYSKFWIESCYGDSAIDITDKCDFRVVHSHHICLKSIITSRS